jgi:tRNA nucleotidyltransferase (CCA-adding enzyme)
MALELIKRGIAVKKDDATIAMSGIYSDTGYFTHENVCNSDFQAASYLMDCGASLPVISSYMKALKEDHQIELFHEIINQMVYQEINGHFMIFSFIVLEKQAGGLAAIVEKISEIENPDAVMAVFYFRNENNVLLVGRSRSGEIDCEAIMKHFGGGGHPRSASALIRNMSGRAVLEALLGFLHSALSPAAVAGSVMQRQIHCIREGWSMLDASMFLERTDHSGAPVVDAKNELVGILTLKNIMKARKAGQMRVPVKSYMRTRIITCDINTTLRNVEDLLYRNNIGHLPVMENGRMAGFLTRTDLIRAAGGS